MTTTAAGEIRPPEALVRNLIRTQAPEFAGLPLVPSPIQGSSNWVFRLGEKFAVRLPRTDAYARDLATEIEWLPTIEQETSTPTPSLVLAGEPSAAFPRPWAIVSWIHGERPGDLDPAAQARLAYDLAAFLAELHAIDVTGQPVGPPRWGYRSDEPVTEQVDAWADSAADRLADLFDPTAVRAAWQALRYVPPRTTPPALVHTDVSSENLLVHPDGHLAGVIDFGSLGVGDRAVDLLYAWSLFDAPARDLLREATGADDATWVRARAYAFVGPGLLTLHDYRTTMPARTARLTRMVQSIAAEVGVDLTPR